MTLRERSGATELNVDADLVRVIVARARAALFEMPDAEADEIEAEVELDSATEIDREDQNLLSEEKASDATREEVSAMIDTLNVDEQAELVALTYVGRGDYEPEDLENAVRDVKADATGPASGILFEIESFPDLLAVGLDAWEEWRDRQPG